MRGHAAEQSRGSIRGFTALSRSPSRSPSPTVRPPLAARPPARPLRGGVGLVYDDTMLKHPACGCERPDRLVAIMRHLAAQRLPTQCDAVAARECTEAEARLVHSAEHWERLIGLPDSPLRAAQMVADEHTASSSRLAAGSVVELTERVCNGSLRSGFALVRPPGHHAGHSTMQGFCFLNNIAIAARVAQRRHGLKRILIVDWDVHHGQGTEAMLADDPGIMYVSLHRKTPNFYPATGNAIEVGAGAGEGFTVNVPWRRTAMGDAEYRRAFEAVVMPIATEFAPELVLVSAGFDASHGDPLGEMHLTPSAYARMIRDLQTLAGGRIVCALEGGYRLKSTASGVAAALRALIRPDEPVLADAEPHALDAKARLVVDQSCRQTINEVAKAHRAYWGVLHAREPAKQIACATAPIAAAPAAPADADGRAAPSAAPAPATLASQARAAPTGADARAAPSASPAPATLASQALAAAAATDVCRACKTVRSKAQFAKTQWKRSAAGERTCAQCTEEARKGAASQAAN